MARNCTNTSRQLVLASFLRKLAHNFLSLTNKKAERLSHRSAFIVVI
ncbi:MAG: hypothetical protein PUG74_10290 [Prevotellaceae bacterium]|nr:hypothetical protein [Prevotellaceae bacterium]